MMLHRELSTGDYIFLGIGAYFLGVLLMEYIIALVKWRGKMKKVMITFSYSDHAAVECEGCEITDKLKALAVLSAAIRKDCKEPNDWVDHKIRLATSIGFSKVYCKEER